MSNPPLLVFDNSVVNLDKINYFKLDRQGEFRGMEGEERITFHFENTTTLAIVGAEGTMKEITDKIQGIK